MPDFGIWAAWTGRKRIDLPIPTANLVDFPEKVPIIADADIGRACRADGFDIRFTSVDGVPLLKYERESFAVAGGEATGIFWVKTNVAMAGTYVWCYYGNLSAPDGADPEAVWDTNFKAVYHMKDATTSTILDSTANSNDGAKDAANKPAEVAGKIGKGQDFGGNADKGRIVCGADASLSGADELTVEAWLNYDGLQQTYPAVVSRFTGSVSGYIFRMHKSSNKAYLNLNWAGGNQDFFCASAIGSGWRHIAFTYKASTLKVNTFFEGAPDSTQDATHAMVGANKTLYLGEDNSGWYFDGLMDEVRISSVARSAAWIAYEYANMNSAVGGLTWGAEQSSVKKSHAAVRISREYFLRTRER